MARSRREIILVTLYALSAAAWVVVARGVIPPIIRDAYHGRSLALFNRAFQRPNPFPVEYYLYGYWWPFWKAVLRCLPLHLAVVLVILKTDRWFVRTRSLENRRAVRAMNGWLIAFAFAFLMLTALSGSRHDYGQFLEMWEFVRAGRDPWWIHEHHGFPINNYGPLFNVLAPLVWWDPLAPKLLFSFAYCLFVVIFLKSGMAQPEPGGFPAHSLLAWLLSPFPWVEIALYGHFDVLVAIPCVAAVAFMLRDRETLSGLSLALGFLLKLFPIVIVPFFAFHGRRVRVRLLSAAGMLMFLGYAVSVLLWGPSTFRPFTYLAKGTGGSDLMSIFRYLKSSVSPLRLFVDNPNVDAWSLPCLVFAGLLVFLTCLWRRTEPATSALLAVLTSLLFYKVGNPQYQMILFLLMACWMRYHWRELAEHRGLAIAIASYFGWLTLFDSLFCYIGGATSGYHHGSAGWTIGRGSRPSYWVASC